MNPRVFQDLKISEDSNLRNAVVISNPLGEENSLMRTTTLPAMLDVMHRNYNQRIEEVKFFELGTIYIPEQLPITQLPQEQTIVTMGMYGGVDFYDLKGVIEELLDSLGVKEYEFTPEKSNPSFHSGRTAKVHVGGKELGLLGEIHPDVTHNYQISTRCYVAMLDFNMLLKSANLVPQYKPLPKYPAVTRDIAVLVKEDIMVKQIEDIISYSSAELLEDIHLFDVYKGKQTPEGMKSVAYAITFRAEDRTLTDEDVNKVFDKIIINLESKLGAELRK